MTIEALILLACWALAAWFVRDHFRSQNKAEHWTWHLGEVDITEPTRQRAVKEAERLERLDREAKIRASLHADLVTRRERMRHHPQPWHL